jgi:hypothetical protein
LTAAKHCGLSLALGPESFLPWKSDTVIDLGKYLAAVFVNFVSNQLVAGAPPAYS